jgi:hypothetical protein
MTEQQLTGYLKAMISLFDGLDDRYPSILQHIGSDRLERIFDSLKTARRHIEGAVREAEE